MGITIMKKTKRILITVSSFLTCTLNSCSKNMGDYIRVGFERESSYSEITPAVGLAFEGKRKQNIEAEFKVYIGAFYAFKELWDANTYGTNPGYGCFAIKKMVKSKEREVVFKDYKMVHDFPNFEKYPLTYENIEGVIDGWIPHYKYYFDEKVSLKQYGLTEGYVCFYLCYYDDINLCEFAQDVYGYGMYEGGAIEFQINGNSVTFGEKIF